MIDETASLLAETYRNQLMTQAKTQRLLQKIKPDRPKIQFRWAPESGELQVFLRLWPKLR